VGNPFDQFDAQPASSAGNPFDQFDVSANGDAVAAAMQRQASLPANQRSAAFAALPQAIQNGIQAKIKADAQAASTPAAQNAAFQQVQAQNVASQPAALTALQGVGKSFVDTGRGIGELLGVESPQDVANARQSDQALMGSGAGQVGYWIGQGAQVVGGAALGGIGGAALKAAGVAGAVPGVTSALTSGAGRIASGSAIGAALGYASPYASEGEHVADTVGGALAGPLVAGAAKVAQLGGRGVMALGQRYLAPDAVAATRVGKILDSAGVTPTQLANGADAVTGVQPTLAQVVQTPEAVQLERAARNNPVSGPSLAAQDLQNSAARTAVLQQHVLSPSDLAAARATRTANFSPIADALKNGPSVDVGPLRYEAANLAQHGNNAMTRSAANKVLSFIDDNTAKVGDAQGTIQLSDLNTLQHDLGTIVKQANPEAINTSQAVRELQPFKNAIVNTVDSVVPGYQGALAQYAQDSAPINTSKTISDLLSPTKATATDLTGEPTLTAARLKSVLTKDDNAPFKMTPEARQDLENVQASLQSRNAAQRSIGPMGSPTEENRLNQLVNRGAQHAGATAGAISGSYVAPGVGTVAGLLLGHGADMLDRAASNRIAAATGRLVANPGDAATALQRYLALVGRRQAFNDALVPVGQYGGLALNPIARYVGAVSPGQQ
jgi:hypothetical protein